MTDTLAEVSAETVLVYVDPAELVPNPVNRRRQVLDMKSDRDKAFVASIKARGVEIPVIAFERDKVDGTLGREKVLIGGHRRTAGALEARVTSIPVLLVPEPSLSEQRFKMLTENGHRRDFTPMEEALAILDLVAGTGCRRRRSLIRWAVPRATCRSTWGSCRSCRSRC